MSTPPKYPQWKLAAAKYQQGDLPGALTLYREATQTHPDDADLWHQIAIIEAQLNRSSAALEAIDRAIIIATDCAAFYHSKGNILLRMGDLAAAKETYQIAVKLNPHYAIAYLCFGRCDYLGGDFVAARQAYEKALTITPTLAAAQYNYGVLLAKLGELDKALTALNRSVELNPQQPAAHGQIAMLYLQLGQPIKAITHFKQRLEWDPNHTDTWYHLGLAYLDNQQASLAITCFEKVLQQQPDHPDCQHYLATAYLQNGDRSKALSYYLRQLSVQPLVDSYYNVGVLMMYAERHREAIDYLKKALELDANYIPAHLNLGSLYLKVNQTNAAIFHYQQVAERKPDDVEIQHILTALQQQTTPEKAPDEYLQHLFDQYAPHYDKHLTEYLHYTTPQQLYRLLTVEISLDSQTRWKILDLGCGTGLCGELFKAFSAQLIGIDISTEMVAAAKAKQVYDQLVVANIESALPNYHGIDLVLAADVFTYIGNLEPVFRLVATCLRSQGWFAFSVEKTYHEPYQLQQTIRYAHSRVYLTELAKTHGFTLINCDDNILRQQKNEQVLGYLVLLQKNA